MPPYINKCQEQKDRTVSAPHHNIGKTLDEKFDAFYHFNKVDAFQCPIVYNYISSLYDQGEGAQHRHTSGAMKNKIKTTDQHCRTVLRQMH